MFPMIFVPASISNCQSPFFLTPYTLHPNMVAAHYFTSKPSGWIKKCWPMLIGIFYSPSYIYIN